MMQLSLAEISAAGLESQLAGPSAMFTTLYNLYCCPADAEGTGPRVVILDQPERWAEVARSRAQVRQTVDEEAVCEFLIDRLQRDGRRCGSVAYNTAADTADDVVYRGSEGFGLALGSDAVRPA